MAAVTIRAVRPADRAEWLRMRRALWPDGAEDHDREVAGLLASRSADAVAVFVAERSDGRLGGFLEVGTRAYAEGCRTSPVGYVEGWWVDPDLRRGGVGAALVAAAEAWARSRGLTEMASDTELDNRDSQAAHAALGYASVERIVCFRKAL